MNLTRKAQKPFVLSLVVGLMFLLTACPGDPVPGTAPDAVNDSYEVEVGANGTFTVPAPGVLGNDDGDNLTAEIVGNVPSGSGNVVLNPNGSFVFTPAAGFTGPSTSFTYAAVNDEGLRDEATVTLTFDEDEPEPDELEAQNDSFTVAPGEAVTITNAQLQANDTIPADLAATTTVDVTDTGGELTVNEDGTYTYTAAADAAVGSTYTFTYTLSAGEETSDPATVTITVAGDIDPGPGTGEYDVNFQSETLEGPAPDGYIPDFGQPFDTRNGQTYGWVTITNGVATDTGCTIIGNGRDRRLDPPGSPPAVPQDYNPLLATFMHMQGADVLSREGSFNGVAENCAWRIQVPAGTYNVSLALGEAQLQDAAPTTTPPPGPYPAYQVNINGVVFPETAYTPPNNNNASNFDPPVTDGDPRLFVSTTDPGLPVTVSDDGTGNGTLTILPTGRNTKITYVSINSAGEEED